MNDEPRAELHAAFARRLASVSPEHEARIHASGRRFQTRRRNRLYVAFGSCGTGMAAALTAAAIILSAGAPVAAGWTRVPTTPSPAAIRAATAACNWLNDRSDSNRQLALAGTPVLTDARGSYTSAIYVSAGTARICISNGHHTATGLATDPRTMFLYPSVPADQVSRPTGGGGFAPGFPQDGSRTKPNEYNSAYGIAGTAVTGIVIRLADGTTVKATVQGGWYFAWWPGNSSPTAIAATTQSGDATSKVSCTAGTPGCLFAQSPVFASRHRRH
jgi:hypothetical protein